MGERLAKETAEDSNLKEGEWILVFNNVNFQKKVRHERKQRHTESWDFTSRLAVKASRLPPPELMEETDEPQGSRGKLQRLNPFFPAMRMKKYLWTGFNLQVSSQIKD